MAIIAAVAIAAIIVFATFVVAAQPKPSHQLRNAYWPYSVETVIRDR